MYIYIYMYSQGKEIYNRPFAGRHIGRICMSLRGNALMSADDIENACFQGERGEVRMWSVSQPPTLQEILESARIRDEYAKVEILKSQLATRITM